MKHEGGGRGKGAWEGAMHSDIDRRHSIAIACPFVSRSNPADMKRRVIKPAALWLLLFFL
jgi:hypothetical protein